MLLRQAHRLSPGDQIKLITSNIVVVTRISGAGQGQLSLEVRHVEEPRDYDNVHLYIDDLVEVNG